jgi:acyl-CoA hydrolase
MALPFAKLTADEAASLIHHGSTVGFSGFTPAGAPKIIPLAIAARAESEHTNGKEFQIGVLTGASTGPSLDGALAKAGAISFRTRRAERGRRVLTETGPRLRSAIRESHSGIATLQTKTETLTNLVSVRDVCLNIVRCRLLLNRGCTGHVAAEFLPQRRCIVRINLRVIVST